MYLHAHSRTWPHSWRSRLPWTTLTTSLKLRGVDLPEAEGVWVCDAAIVVQSMSTPAVSVLVKLEARESEVV